MPINLVHQIMRHILKVIMKVKTVLLIICNEIGFELSHNYIFELFVITLFCVQSFQVF